MKRTLITLLAIVSLLGTVACSLPSRKRQVITEHFKTAEVQQVPEQEYGYIVRDAEGNIWYVECLGFDSPKITSQALLFSKK